MKLRNKNVLKLNLKKEIKNKVRKKAKGTNKNV